MVVVGGRLVVDVVVDAVVVDGSWRGGSTVVDTGGSVVTGAVVVDVVGTSAIVVVDVVGGNVSTLGG